MSPPVILGSAARKRAWGWQWRAGCILVQIHEPVARAAEPHLEQYLVQVFVYGTLIVPAYESSPARAGRLVTRKLLQISNCLNKAIGSA